MNWLYKYEGSMDTNDADFVYSSGELGTFDDSDPNQMKEVHLMMMYMNSYASKFDEGTADCDEVRKSFREKCESYGLKEADYKDFHLGMYDYKPRDPNCDSYAHDLQFTFTRIPADVQEESVDEYCLTQYYNVQSK